jgi:hypothetical protein
VAYDAAILAEAQELYFTGQSAARISAEMKRRHPDRCKRICEKTVLKWISTPDAFGKTWLDKKALAQGKAEEQRIDKTADEFGKLNGLLVDAIQIMKKRLDVAKDFAPMNPEYTAQVLMQLIGKRMEGLKTSPITGAISGEHVQLLFEVIQADGELGPVFERRKSDLLKAYQEKLAAAGLAAS